MERLHRTHARLIIALAVFRTLRGIAFFSLVVAGIIWVINRSLSDRPARLLIGCVVVWGLWQMLRVVGEFLGPPEPSVKSSTELETRRALRRAGMLRRTWR